MAASRVNSAPPRNSWINAHRVVDCDEYFLATSLAVTVRILAGTVDLEFVVSMLHQRDCEALRDKAWDQSLDQCGLATAGPAGESKNLHLQPAPPPRTAVMNSPFSFV